MTPSSSAVPATPAETPFGYIRQTLAGGFLPGVLAITGVAVASQVAEAAAPWLLGQLVGSVVANPTATQPGPEMLGLIAAWTLAWLLARLHQWLDVRTMPPLRGHAQVVLNAHLRGHSPRFFNDNFAGSIGQKVKQAGEAVIQLLGMVGNEASRILVLFVISVVLLASVRPGYALFIGCWMAAFVALSAGMARRCVAHSRHFTETVSTLSGQLIDTLSNIGIARSFARLPEEGERIAGYIASEAAASQSLRRFLYGMHALQSLATLLLMIAFLVMAVGDAGAGRIGVGDLTAVLGLGLVIVQTVQNLSFRMLDFFIQYGTLREALNIISAPHEIVSAPDAPPLRVTQAAIEFRDVAFAHPDGTQVFAGLDLRIAAGEKVGLVGASGAGKSTLIHLLRRHYDPQRGAVLIDGQDIRTVDLASLNDAIVDVPQTPGIFHRSLRDNIAYGRPDSGEEAFLQAATAAHCHEFASRRGEGYATLVGERGIKLSGGERQRVAIARALLKEARILVLDEATSALDSESEHFIQQALWQLFAGKTVIAIAHRLSTLAGMDRLVVLEHGRIVEQGRHAELIARGGRYAELWARQAGGFIDGGGSEDAPPDR